MAAFRGDHLVFADVSFSLEPGGAMVLVGRNGSGKTTLLRLIAGLMPRATGEVLWAGEDALADLPTHGLRLAYLGHQDALKLGLTAVENLALWARIPRARRADAIEVALAAVGLEDLAHLPARMLSAGQRRRVAIARLLVSDAMLWLLDEPTTALDTASVGRLGRLAAAASCGGRDGDCRDASRSALARCGGGQPLVIGGMWRILAREVRLSLRHGADTVAVLLFFVLAAGLFPLAVGPEPALLGRLAPGTIWVCALLAALLPLDRLFGADFEDGSLDQLLLSGLPPSLMALAKAAAHWVTTGLPLLVVAGPVAIMLRMPPGAIGPLLLGLVPGTLTLSLLGTTGAALVIGARRGGVLLPLLVLPLATPVLIFGAAAASAALTGLSPRPELLLLAALLVLALPLCPIAAGAAARAAAE